MKNKFERKGSSCIQVDTSYERVSDGIVLYPVRLLMAMKAWNTSRNSGPEKCELELQGKVWRRLSRNSLEYAW